MCVKEPEQVGEEMGNDGDNSSNNDKQRPSQHETRNSQIQNWDDQSPLLSSSHRNFLANSLPLGSICEDRVVADKQSQLNFVPALRSGEWSDIGSRPHMEDTHICITDLAEKFGCNLLNKEAVSFYGVFDGHGGKGAAQFVRDHLPRVIVEDADFPLELEKVMTRSFMETDAAFARKCSLESSLSSGTTALTAMIFGRSLLVANAGDCRAVLSRCGRATEMSNDHKPSCKKERTRVESLGGYVDEEFYLNSQLGVTRALGNWHLKGMKEMGDKSGPLSAEPELKLITLTREDEFLIIGSDGIWDVFSSQNAVDFARRRLQEHNDVKLCCKQIVEEALNRGDRQFDSCNGEFSLGAASACSGRKA